MTEKEFLQEMKMIMEKTFRVDSSDLLLCMDTKIVNGEGEDDLDLSSIDYVFFISKVEETFEIVYDFDDLMITLGDVYHYINLYYERFSNDHK